jgi:AcrR family transcriptional regulator
MTLSELSRRDRKKQETRRRIFEAAVALFREKGFEETTVDEITLKADVGRGTFFNYFPRKESVLAYLSEEKLELAEEGANELLTANAPMRQKLVELFLHAVSAYEQDLELSRFVFAEWMKRGFAPTREVEARWQRIQQALFAQGRANGEIRADVSDARAEGLLSGVYVTTIFEWLYTQECACPGFGDLRTELAARLDVVLDGLAPRAGVAR